MLSLDLLGSLQAWAASHYHESTYGQLALFTLALVGLATLTRHWLVPVPAKTPAALHLVPSSSTYPRPQYTQARRIPFYAFLSDFLANRIEIKQRDGQGLGALPDYLSFPFTVRTAWTLVVRLLPGWLWHAKASDRKNWCRFHEHRDDLFEALLGRQRIGFMHRFSDHDESLDNAGENDLPRIAQEMLHINADDRLLNLSTGWGTLELYLGSQFPLFITTVSPSQEQAQHAYDLMERAGISERVQIETCDFRDLPPQEQFTKLVCLEALDWVGQKNLGDFFQRCADVLVPGGTALIYCTTSPSAFTGSWSQYLGETLHYHLYTLTTICPGRDTALFATLNDYLDEIHRAGLEVDLIENISLDASMTYARWFENWDQARHIIHMRYGEDVYRQWELYLAWSSSILLRGGLSKHSLLLRKPIR